MPRPFDVSPYLSLVQEAQRAFLEDTGYSIAIAKSAGTLIARRQVREDALADDPDDVV